LTVNASRNDVDDAILALREAREREAATREILQVISQSRSDYGPVFDRILDRAIELCQAPFAYLHLISGDKTHLEIVAHRGTRTRFVDLMTQDPVPMDPTLSSTARAVFEKREVQVEDLAAEQIYRDRQPHRVYAVDVEGMRTFLAVPLISGDEALGVISLYRREVRRFEDSQVDLVKTFAQQSVIAIENVRLFSELQTRLSREKATREILEVISRSRANETPVFDVILESASQLCDAPLAFLSMANEARTHVTVPAHRGVRPEFAAALTQFHEPMENSQLVAVRAIAEGRDIRSDNLIEDDHYRADGRWRAELVETEGVRSILVVPLMRGDEGIGAIILYRREVNPFSDDDLALVKTFAAQAVIAVDNVKQFKALEARTEEVQALNFDLEGRVEVQVGELERLGRLKRFLSPQVVDAVVSSGDESLLSSHRALIAVLFCDIRGFTAFCEMAEPEETIEVLQTYHEEMGKLINAHGAGVDHRSGDGIMVIFNDPLPCDNPAGDALRMALAMRERMATLCKDWRRLGHRLGFGVGISLGYATVGMVGSEGRYDYTASGTAVNLAARLCDEAADGDILLSPRAYAAVEDEFAAESAGELDLKGIHAPVEVFRVTSNRVTSERPDLDNP
jgi:class 3 adenylate cyclase